MHKRDTVAGLELLIDWWNRNVPLFHIRGMSCKTPATYLRPSGRCFAQHDRVGGRRAFDSGPGTRGFQRCCIGSVGPVLDRYEDLLLGQGTPWTSRSVLLDTASRFLSWLANQENIDDLAHIVSDSDKCWNVREAFLIADCPDHDVRHDLRAAVNRFLRFVTSPPAKAQV